MFEYLFVEASAYGVFRVATYKEEIMKHASLGWRFVSSIPSDQNSNGYIRTHTLIFERRLDRKKKAEVWCI